MEGSVPSANAGDVDGESCLSCDQSQASDYASTCLISEEKAKLKQLKVPHGSSFGETDDETVKEDETSDLCPDFGCHLSGSTGVSVENEKCGAELSKGDQESIHLVLLDKKRQKGLSRLATFPCPKEGNSDVSSLACCKSASCSAKEKKFSSSDIGYARSVSLPTSFKLVSALKGSRAQNGACSDVPLRVKWAPDVYDPPATSLSHTVNKSNHQRPKAKKANKRNKNKGKSSRGNSSGRRNGTGSVVEPANQRLLPDGYSNSEVETMDFSNQEAKCGSSFMREGHDKMHIAIGEAS